MRVRVLEDRAAVDDLGAGLLEIADVDAGQPRRRRPATLSRSVGQSKCSPSARQPKPTESSKASA